METAVWGLFGTVVGALTSMATTYIQSRSAESLRAAAVREERNELRRAFQRATLVELQDVLHVLCRAPVQVHLEDLSAFRRTSVLGRNRVSDDVNEGERVLRRRAILLSSRVSSDDLRASITSGLQTLTAFSMARVEEEAARWHAAMNSELPAALENIGNELRSQQ